MSKQVPWTNEILKNFEELALLNDEECYIMESRCRGESVISQSLHLNKSEATIHRMISLLKKKYDAVQREFPDRFPARKYSAKETWMDTH